MTIKKGSRRGVELEVWVHSKCAELLLMLPSPDARQAAVSWLQARIVPMSSQGVVAMPADPRQPEIPIDPFGAE